MESERLVHMANQIADFFRAYGETEAIAGTENHIVQFWDPRMKKGLVAHLDTGGEGLSKIALAAAGKIRERQALPR